MTAAHAVLGVAYDLHVVALSLAVATLASYIALTTAERLTVSTGPARGMWLAGGAMTMGTGIWSMHFTGMLTLHIPIAVMYDVPTVALSLLAATTRWNAPIAPVCCALRRLA